MRECLVPLASTDHPGVSDSLYNSPCLNHMSMRLVYFWREIQCSYKASTHKPSSSRYLVCRIYCPFPHVNQPIPYTSKHLFFNIYAVQPHTLGISPGRTPQGGDVSQNILPDRLLYSDHPYTNTSYMAHKTQKRSCSLSDMLDYHLQYDKLRKRTHMGWLRRWIRNRLEWSRFLWYRDQVHHCRLSRNDDSHSSDFTQPGQSHGASWSCTQDQGNAEERVDPGFTHLLWAADLVDVCPLHRAT